MAVQILTLADEIIDQYETDQEANVVISPEIKNIAGPMSQATYDAIPTKDPETWYLITE